MAYFDFMVVPVPKAKLAAYRSLVKKGAAAWKRCGALAYVEAVADDVRLDLKLPAGFQKHLETRVEPDFVEQIINFIRRRRDERDLFTQTFARTDCAFFPAFFDVPPFFVGKSFQNRVNCIAFGNRAVEI